MKRRHDQPFEPSAIISEYQSEKARLATYDNWPKTAPVHPTSLAQAGLFYTGIGDKVKCAFCLGGILAWETGDVPLMEHQKHFPRCVFVQYLLKIDKLPLQLRRTSTDDTVPMSMNQLMNPEKIEDSTAVQIIRQMGFSMRIIIQAVRKCKDRNLLTLKVTELLDSVLQLKNEGYNSDDGDALDENNTAEVTNSKKMKYSSSRTNKMKSNNYNLTVVQNYFINSPPNDTGLITTECWPEDFGEDFGKYIHPMLNVLNKNKSKFKEIFHSILTTQCTLDAKSLIQAWYIEKKDKYPDYDHKEIWTEFLAILISLECDEAAVLLVVALEKDLLHKNLSTFISNLRYLDEFITVFFSASLVDMDDLKTIEHPRKKCEFFIIEIILKGRKRAFDLFKAQLYKTDQQELLEMITFLNDN